MDGIYCLCVAGGSLNDPMRNLLFDTAQEMMEEGQEKRRIRSSTGVGQITTEGEQASIGGISGTVFHAELDTDLGSFRVTYLVRPSRTFRSIDATWQDLEI